MTTWALIPVKGFQAGKSRLAQVLAPLERSRLARDLFEGVSSGLLACNEIDQVAVVTDSEEVRQMARRLGMIALSDTTKKTHLGDVVDQALTELIGLGATRVVVCMSDLPSLKAAEIARIVRALDDADCVIVPDLAQQGTNVLGLRSPHLTTTCFGHEDSFARHRAAAQAQGLRVNVLLSPTLGFDIDEPHDLNRLSTGLTSG